MKKATGRFVVLALLVVAFFFGGCATREQEKPAIAAAPEKAAAPTVAPKRTQPLFVIERSKNANVVHYDAQLTPDGNLDPDEPVIAYWVILAQDGRRQELDWVEKMMAYGINLKPDPSVNGYQMTIVTAPQQSITVRKVGGAVRAEIVMDGRPAILQRIYINVSEELTGPAVHYLEIYGLDVQTAEKRVQKIIPK
jgi:hypothetical protein